VAPTSTAVYKMITSPQVSKRVAQGISRSVYFRVHHRTLIGTTSSDRFPSRVSYWADSPRSAKRTGDAGGAIFFTPLLFRVATYWHTTTTGRTFATNTPSQPDENKRLESLILCATVTTEHNKSEVEAGKVQVQPGDPPETRLERMYEDLFFVFDYLGRFQNEEDAVEYLRDFERSEALEDSDMYKARKAIVAIVNSIIYNTYKIPPTAPIRTSQPQIFSVIEALVPLYDMYLQGRTDPPPQEEWSVFWDRANPILLTLGQLIDQAGLSPTPANRK